ncbi:hypothetical protein [Flavobacterium columnare]|uniref:Uncharacterized protein n=2 Tax=Flavobacterium TaxID=237 RepID=A0AA94F1G6_9FLAO|nr:hypothetical protein [Flavobacterium columnare]MCH4829981.1 hypothetical protein [Flavobacterium columnare]MCH4832639.1 hypothetical protein [Flavobacterium columnare]
MNEEDMCGRFIYVRAYIDDPKTEGETKVWKHNRFRWFDREVLEEEIEEKTTKGMPWKVNQAGTSLCGMACIFYLFAKEKPNDYKNLLLNCSEQEKQRLIVIPLNLAKRLQKNKSIKKDFR